MSEEQFQIAFRKYGPPMRGEQGSDTEALTNSLLTLLRWAVATQRKTIGPKGRTYCDIIQNPSFNAVATTYQGHDLVTLFLGAINFIFSVYFTFLSDPRTLPGLGDGSGHSTPADALDSIRAGRAIYTTDHVPRNDQRAEAARNLSYLTCFFILLHEVGHIVRGHPMFLQRKYGLDAYEEVSPSQAIPDQSDIRMAFEWEADEYAAGTSFKLTRLILDKGAFPALRGLHPDFTWGISMSMAFLLMAHMGGGNLDRKSSTHPRPLFRYIWSRLSVEGSDSCKAFSPNAESLEDGFKETAGWFARNGLGFQQEEESALSRSEEMKREHDSVHQALRRESALLDQIAAERDQAAARWLKENGSNDAG